MGRGLRGPAILSASKRTVLFVVEEFNPAQKRQRRRTTGKGKRKTRKAARGRKKVLQTHQDQSADLVLPNGSEEATNLRMLETRI